MLSLKLLTAFLVTTTFYAAIPGPAMLYAAARTLATNRWSGLMAALGIHLGGYVHVAAAAAGLSILFHAMPILYVGVKLAGAAYLIWLGSGLICRSPEGESTPAQFKPRSGRRAFLESVIVEALNPKTALFFLAFLPQFIDTAGSVSISLQFLILGTIVNMIFSLADIVCVLLASVLVARLRRSSRMQRFTRRAGGCALVGLGAHLVLESR